MQEKIILIGIDTSYSAKIQSILAEEKYKVSTVESIEQALSLQDINDPNRSALALVSAACVTLGQSETEKSLTDLNLPFLVLLENQDDDFIQLALKAGAGDFVPSPVVKPLLLNSVRNTINRQAIIKDLSRSENRLEESTTLTQLSEQNKGLQRAVQLGMRAAKSNIPVLIEGETGTGKTLFAKSVRLSSDRRNKPLTSIDCNNREHKDLEQEFFGAEGKLARAAGGTLLIEEICNLSLEVQQKLAKAIHANAFYPQDSDRSIKLSARLIATTSQNLIELVQRGLFSPDLYYQISVFPITLPSLKDRREDIYALADRFLHRIAKIDGRYIEGIDDQALELLDQHNWPGNVRELENLIYRASILCEGGKLSHWDFPSLAHDQPASASYAPLANRPASGQHLGFTQSESTLSRRGSSHMPVVHQQISSNYGKIDLLNDRGQLRSLEEIEAETIRFAISHVGGNMSVVARDLKIGRTTLYRKIKEDDQTGGTLAEAG